MTIHMILYHIQLPNDVQFGVYWPTDLFPWPSQWDDPRYHHSTSMRLKFIAFEPAVPNMFERNMVCFRLLQTS
jgi:hypothetical protein